MIRNQWYVVLESREVKAGKALGVTRMGEKMVFWRTQAGRTHCMSDICPHIGAPLCLGKINGDMIVCPFHGFEYDATGQCKLIPSLGQNGAPPKAMRVKTYPVHEAHGWIWIFWGESQADLQPPKWFDIDDRFCTSGFSEHWPVHYSRMVENQLDVMHLAFVHTDTIGRGKRVVVEGPQARWVDENVLHLWVYNRLDNGTPPRKAEELPEPKRPPFLVLNFPNLWENRISEDMRILAAFVPVDDQNSVIYIRNYQRFVRVPVLRDLIGLVLNISSAHILHQDRRVVLKQLPIRTELKKMGEKLVQGDAGILAFRKRRHEEKVKSGQIDHKD